MKQHLGAVLTSSLAAVALGLALLQAAVLLHAAPMPLAELVVPGSPSHRSSAPAGGSAVPNIAPVAGAPARSRTSPAPEVKPPEERRRLPPRQQRSLMPGQQPGPRPARKLAA
jgi:hypothetical protein